MEFILASSANATIPFHLRSLFVHQKRNMSIVTISSLKRMTAPDLSAKLIAEQQSPSLASTIAVVDVRDDGKVEY